MFELEFYEDRRGAVEIADYLDELQEKAKTSKDARINRQKILAYMAALQECGTRLGEPFVKFLEEDIFHHFVKKSQKTPKKEIEKAKRNRDDWLERNKK